MLSWFRIWIPACLGVLLFGSARGAAAVPGKATGYVYLDRNANGVRDSGERGVAGVRVSNQREFTRTDRRGRWELPLLETGETTFFVIKPRGYTPPLSEDRLPQFYYTHKPAGSSKLKFRGLPATGALPESIDFALYPQSEPREFQALFFGDTQPRDLIEVNYFKHDIVEELIGQTKARFGVTLGDIVFDDLGVMAANNAAVAMIGIPWWNVIGNHDVNTDAPSATDFDDTYNRVYGPSYFSFDYGPVHFVSLNNIHWVPPDQRGTNGPTWRSAIDPQQLEWLAGDLAGVPQRQLVLLMMHVPLNDMVNREAVYRLIEKRPYCLSIAGHTHWHEHRYIKRADGWLGREPHHHIVNVTACGSWWTGQPDELGIPHATMADGAPNGYTVLTFTEKKVRVDYKAARHPVGHQLNIMAPEEVSAGAATSTEVHVNVFNGSEHSVVHLRVRGHGSWQSLEKVLEPDPSFVAARNREPVEPGKSFRRLPAPMKSPHLWKGHLPAGLPPGEHVIEVRATDDTGRVHPGSRLITVK